MNTAEPSLWWLLFRNVGNGYRLLPNDIKMLEAAAVHPALDITVVSEGINLLTAVMIRCGGGQEVISGIIATLLERGVDPCHNFKELVRGTNGAIVSPLQAAFEYRHEGILKMLLETGRFDKQDLNRLLDCQDGEPWMIKAAKHDRKTAMAALLKAGVDPNIIGTNGQSALFCAVSSEAVDTLLAAGANPLIRDAQGRVCHELWQHNVSHANLSKMSTQLKRVGTMDEKSATGLLWHALYRNPSKNAFERCCRKLDGRSGLDDLRSTVLLGSMGMQYKGGTAVRGKAIAQLLNADEAGEWTQTHRALALLMLSSVLGKLTGAHTSGNYYAVSAHDKALEHWRAMASAASSILLGGQGLYGEKSKPSDIRWDIPKLRKLLVGHGDWPAAINMLSQVSSKLVQLDGDEGANKAQNIILSAAMASYGTACFDEALKQVALNSGKSMVVKSTDGEKEPLIWHLARGLDNVGIFEGGYGFGKIKGIPAPSIETTAAALYALCARIPDAFETKLANTIIDNVGRWTRDDWANLDRSGWVQSFESCHSNLVRLVNDKNDETDDYGTMNLRRKASGLAGLLDGVLASKNAYSLATRKNEGALGRAGGKARWRA